MTPERPAGLDTLIAAVGAESGPAVLILDREGMQKVIAYIKALEHEAAMNEGWFW